MKNIFSINRTYCKIAVTQQYFWQGIRIIMKEKKLLILLHGYGANGMDLMPIGDYVKNAIKKFELDYFAPDAFEVCDSNPYGFQWFKLSPDREYSYNGEVEKVSTKVLSDIIIQETQNRQIRISDVILCGFSQGGMVALSTSLTIKEKPLATICLSGLLVDNIHPIGETQPNILVMHGEEDDVLSIDFYHKTKQQLDDYGIEYQAKSYPNLGHSISQEELDDLIIFLDNL